MYDMTTEEQSIVSDVMALGPDHLTFEQLWEVASLLRALPSAERLDGTRGTRMLRSAHWFGTSGADKGEALVTLDHVASENTMLVYIWAVEEVFFDVPVEPGERMFKLGGTERVGTQR
jgi:hypothetical protein